MNCNDYVSAVSNLSVLMSKFDVTRPSNFHKVLKTSVLVVLMYEAKKSFAIVLTMSRCHFDEMVTAHRNEVLTSFSQSLLFDSPVCHKLRSRDPFYGGRERTRPVSRRGYHLFMLSPPRQISLSETGLGTRKGNI